ncbi:hypothetical protein GN958_ATG06021 [Phytophthora infestans]|uniref:Uncharacterized protein n=2 Tax=Phytophthora infestans TaxID=4787 RepID=A0A8S9UWV2_PHYIN|nr:hypothetical protein GN958_ATG06021 [Phytophthora infestans]
MKPPSSSRCADKSRASVSTSTLPALSGPIFFAICPAQRPNFCVVRKVEKVSDKMMPEAEDSAPVPQEEQFTALYMAKVLDKLRENDKTPQAAELELQNGRREQHASNQATVAEQTKQNLLDRLVQVEALETLQKAAALRKAQDEAGYEQEKNQLQSAEREREDVLQLLDRLEDEVEQQKHEVAEHERSREEHESELAQVNEVWKELQKRNAHRKAAVQVATGVMITDEEDCARVLDQQTQSIQEMHQKQKQLEDEKIDISTHGKRTKRMIDKLSKQNDLRSKDAEVKKHEQEYMTLQQMKHWYDHVRHILESLSGLDITNIADDSLEVQVLKSHSVRLFIDLETTRLQRVQFLTSDVIASDLVDVAVSDKNVCDLLCKYRERVLAL